MKNLIIVAFFLFGGIAQANNESVLGSLIDPTKDYTVNQERLDSNTTKGCIPGGFCSNDKALEYIKSVYYRYEVELIDYYINEEGLQVWLHKIYSKGEKGNFYKVFQVTKTRISGFNKDKDITGWIKIE